jgi:predicted TIM-barrel fold metal-dependent hydrolase
VTIIDNHIHFMRLDVEDRLLRDMEINGVSQFCVLDVGCDQDAPDTHKLAHALWLKSRHPERVFVFGGLDFGGMFDGGRDAPDTPLVEQLDELIAVGCDGLKLIAGKPDSRKRVGQPIDGPAFTPLLQRLEATRFPVLWHVGDPPEFWSESTCPLWARQRGWWYDATYPPKQQIDHEIAAVLERHPALNLILPHFFFLSDDLVAAAALLDRHPNVQLDLAPGVEMFHNFTKQRAAARTFFIRYADRILYGSDSGLCDHQHSPKRSWMIQHFLKTDEGFDVPEDPCMTPDERPPLQGIALPADVLQKIFAANFRRVVGRERPRPLNMPAVRALLRRLAERARMRNDPTRTAERVLAEMA